MPLTRRTLNWISITSALALMIVMAPLMNFGFNADAWLLSARYTARFAFLWFLVPFLAPRWWSSFNAEDTRDTFLAFAAAHIIHFGALMRYTVVSESSLSTQAVVIGGTAYVLMVGVLVRLLSGKDFPRYASLILHYILIVFLLTYATRISSELTRPVGFVGVGTSVLALIARHIPRNETSTTDTPPN